MSAVEQNIGLSNTPIFIRNLDNCPPSYLDDPGRKEFFEIVWLKNENALHTINGAEAMRGDWIYLIPPYRVHQLNKAGKKGILLSFKRDFLDEDVKEFLLDVFKIFNIQGEFSCLQLDAETAAQLAKVYEIMEEEYERDSTSLVILKALLKVFLLQLVRIKEQEFTVQDINQKRVYEFMVLLEMNYQLVRNTDFYAGKLGISSKRLNQILKEKLDKTGMQLIHDRIVLEAKRQIIHSESTIKEIAYDLGFKDRPYFSRFFKQHTGQSPEQFQNEAKNHIISKFNTLV
ncbi:helix-turn-helix domain-containing protein [Dyadobacter sp. CY312]|uniref:helix-turn-helix domain-containing protein n=1 Tax=Dyadobacter sp. CY312 TaxID=2907303 RepID=UPI001F31FC1C|nr:helix-turn-helix domain-containing protein [Dyadobacter sp. CY312]MCE7041694.1 helix-turn-helix domain-containing protein [Dyadobacter sp. CY312]